MQLTCQSRVWYLAYGSNMSLEKLIGGRGIHPTRSARVYIPGWKLTLEIGGLPYQEPAFTSINPIEVPVDQKDKDVVGVAYLITAKEWLSIVASEGGCTVYSNLTLPAKPLSEKDATITGGPLIVHTLGTDFARHPSGHPSERYWNIILEGATHHELPPEYMKFLHHIRAYKPPEEGRQKIGAAIFVALWGPIMGLAEKVTTATTSKTTGKAPLGTILFVRLVLIVMWFMHDHVFAPAFGRGDGLDDMDEMAEMELRGSTLEKC